MVNLTGILVTGSDAEINNNSPNLSKFKQAGLLFTKAVDSVVPLVVQFNQAVGRIFLYTGRILFSEQCQANPKLPFHPKAMKSWVSIVVIYCVASTVEVGILSAVPKNTGSGNLEADITTTTKGVPWTEEEHGMVLLGLQKLGKCDWRGIARNYVHQLKLQVMPKKYFIRQNNICRRKRRPSLFDIVADDIVVSPYTNMISSNDYPNGSTTR